MEKIKIAIVGASGYSGEELISLLLKHEYCSIEIITSRKYNGQSIKEIFPRLAESELVFSAPDVNKIAEKCDLAFLALPHGLAAEYAEPLYAAGLTVIDISADFRLKDLSEYKKYYGVEHPAPNLAKEAVYGLPELYRDKIKDSKLIACPGCYPTSIILPLYPLLSSGAVETSNIIVNSISGVSGAGRKVDLPYIFPECNESIRAYSPLFHRHLPEVEQELSYAAGEKLQINFIPHLAPVNRGIVSTVVCDSKDMDACKKISDFYQDETFVRILKNKTLPDSKHVQMTNFCEISCMYDSIKKKIIVISAIDNLRKGAAGQAVQCMNIIFGFAEHYALM